MLATAGTATVNGGVAYNKAIYKDFKNGAARMAVEAGVPLLPMVLWGSQRIMTKGRKRDLTRGTPIRIVDARLSRAGGGRDRPPQLEMVSWL